MAGLLLSVFYYFGFILHKAKSSGMFSEVKRIVVILLVFGGLFQLTACVGGHGAQTLVSPYPQQMTGTVQKSQVHGQQVVSQNASAIEDAYRLGAGDKIRLIVFKEKDLSGEFDLDGNGVVSLPLIGQVSARNLTVRDLEQKVANKFREGYLRDPKVSIEVLTYRPFFILGEVKKGGEYPFKAGLTVRDAVAMAGGYTYRANNGKVHIRRANTDTEKVYDLNRKVLVYPGDNVRIPERFF